MYQFLKMAMYTGYFPKQASVYTDTRKVAGYKINSLKKNQLCFLYTSKKFKKENNSIYKSIKKMSLSTMFQTFTRYSNIYNHSSVNEHYPFSCKLFPDSSYCEYYCNKYRRANISLRP